MKKANRIEDSPVYFAGALIGLGIVLGSLDIPYYGRRGHPGPGMLPLWIGLAILALSSIGIVRFLINKRKMSKSFSNIEIQFVEKRIHPKFFTSIKLLYIWIGLVGMCILIKPIGFIFAMSIMMLYFLLFVERWSIVYSILFTFFTMIGIWFLFVKLIGLNLPQGLWLSF